MTISLEAGYENGGDKIQSKELKGAIEKVLPSVESLNCLESVSVENKLYMMGILGNDTQSQLPSLSVEESGTLAAKEAGPVVDLSSALEETVYFSPAFEAPRQQRSPNATVMEQVEVKEKSTINDTEDEQQLEGRPTVDHAVAEHEEQVLGNRLEFVESVSRDDSCEVQLGMSAVQQQPLSDEEGEYEEVAAPPVELQQLPVAQPRGSGGGRERHQSRRAGERASDQVIG